VYRAKFTSAESEQIRSDHMAAINVDHFGAAGAGVLSLATVCILQYK
jgi:hypothetical protein